MFEISFVQVIGMKRIFFLNVPSIQKGYKSVAQCKILVLILIRVCKTFAFFSKVQK